MESGKILQQFSKNVEGILQKWKNYRKIWATLEKNFKIFKKSGRSFEEIGNNFLNKFSRISVEILCNFQGNYEIARKLYGNMILKTFRGICEVIFEHIWKNSEKTVKKLLGITKNIY